MIKKLKPVKWLYGLIMFCLLFNVVTGISFAQVVPVSGNQPRTFLPLIFGDSSNVAIVFVSRRIPEQGSIYYTPAKDMPGVGAHSRFRIAAPGKLMIREASGVIRTLVDGSQPSEASMKLIDVNAPDVSYDGKRIVFAGLQQGTYDLGPNNNPGAWRIYSIDVDGANLHQITFNDRNVDLVAAGLPEFFDAYDDTDPIWLPDGRIVFSSTRYPGIAQYSGVRASNLFVVNVDGTALRRITAEKNGADRPVVDPVTGKIVFSRWWRNNRFPLNDLSTIPSANDGFIQKDGLSSDRNKQMDGNSAFASFLWRNAWQLASINPDGTGLVKWHHGFGGDDATHVYGGAFDSKGDFIGNYFPMANMSEAAGFGGLRLYYRGFGSLMHLVGPKFPIDQYEFCPNGTNSNDCSFGVAKGPYVSDPIVIGNDLIIAAYAKNFMQDYGLYAMKLDGSGLRKLVDFAGTTELRAKLIQPRPLPPIISDVAKNVPNSVPPSADGPYNIDGVFTFNALNMYFNAAVDVDVQSAPPVGSASRIRFFIDHQRGFSGRFSEQYWPLLLSELLVNPNGSVINANLPANVPLFEQVRDPNNAIPLYRGEPSGAAHVAGMNYGRPGEVVRCVGCHAGHSMIPLPANDADALWSNVAPGAAVSVSSSRDPNFNGGVNDRRVAKGEIWRYWTSAPGQAQNQWVRLTFPVPVTVRKVRLYNPRQGDEAQSSLQVQGAQVVLYADAGATQQVGVKTTGTLSVSGSDVDFQDVRARVVMVNITKMAGTFYGANVASVAEIEVIARAEAP
jgi:hypothetical protein